MNVAQQDWIKELPPGWSFASLRNVLIERKDFNKNREETNILSVTNDRGVINYREKGNIGNKASDDIDRYKKVHKGDIVANSMNVIIGSVGIAPENGVLSPVYIVMRPADRVDVRYYDYIFKAKGFQAQLKRIGYGILDHRMRIPWDNLKMQLLPKPNLETQQKIADFLDTETAKIDNLIAKQEQLLKLLEEKRRATITHAVTRGLNPNAELKETNIPWLGQIPANWSVKKIKYLVVRRDEKVTSAQDIKYIGLEHVVSFLGKEIATEAQSEPEGLSLKYHKNDVLFGKLRPYLAKVLLTSDSGICSSEFIVLSAKPDIDSEFLKYSLLNNEFVEQVNSSTYGAKMPRANWDFIGNTSLPVPKVNEQREIAAYLDKQEQKAEKLKQKIQTQITLLRERRANLISHAVTGKVKV